MAHNPTCQQAASWDEHPILVTPFFQPWFIREESLDNLELDHWATGSTNSKADMMNVFQDGKYTYMVYTLYTLYTQYIQILAYFIYSTLKI